MTIGQFKGSGLRLPPVRIARSSWALLLILTVTLASGLRPAAAGAQSTRDGERQMARRVSAAVGGGSVIMWGSEWGGEQSILILQWEDVTVPSPSYDLTANLRVPLFWGSRVDQFAIDLDVGYAQYVARAQGHLFQGLAPDIEPSGWVIEETRYGDTHASASFTWLRHNSAYNRAFYFGVGISAHLLKGAMAKETADEEMLFFYPEFTRTRSSVFEAWGEDSGAKIGITIPAGVEFWLRRNIALTIGTRLDWAPENNACSDCRFEPPPPNTVVVGTYGGGGNGRGWGILTAGLRIR